MRNFTVNWFETSGQANFEKYLAEFKDKPNLTFLEIGCFEGQATCWLLDNILTNNDAIIHVIDTFEGSMEHLDKTAHIENLGELFDRFLNNIGSSYKVLIHPGKSQEVLQNEIKIDRTFDFIYVDGSHTAYDTLVDAVLAFQRLKVGGVMIFDDYGWNGYAEDYLCPKLGIDSFLNCFKGQYELLFKEYQVGIKKL